MQTHTQVERDGCWDLVCEQDEKLGAAQRGGKRSRKYDALVLLTQGQVMKVNVGKFKRTD